MAGLYIEHKREYHVMRWLSALVFVSMIFIAAWFAYLWFTTGVKPPLVPLPASAMADTTLDESIITEADKASHKVSKSHPRYISIPSLNIIKARVHVAGLTAYQTLEAPKNISDVAWYKDSATPGQGYGSVILNGHFGGISRDALLKDLSNVSVGDKIILERGDGKEITYILTDKLIQPVQEANTKGIKYLMNSQETSKESLGIMTGAGNWIPRDKTYDKRLLVRAVAD